MSENSSKTSNNSEVYDKSLKLFRQELGKLNSQLEKDIEQALQKVSSRSKNYMNTLKKKLSK